MPPATHRHVAGDDLLELRRTQMTAGLAQVAPERREGAGSSRTQRQPPTDLRDNPCRRLAGTRRTAGGDGKAPLAALGR